MLLLLLAFGAVSVSDIGHGQQRCLFAQNPLAIIITYGSYCAESCAIIIAIAITIITLSIIAIYCYTQHMRTHTETKTQQTGTHPHTHEQMRTRPTRQMGTQAHTPPRASPCLPPVDQCLLKHFAQANDPCNAARRATIFRSCFTTCCSASSHRTQPWLRRRPPVQRNGHAHR